MNEPYCRIDGVIARGANKAVIFRRGPSKHTQMLVWDLSTDIVTPGQWVTKQSVHVCGVSDDCQYVAIIGSDYRPAGIRNFGHKMQTWLAISHPPYFTAVEIWELGFLSRFLGFRARSSFKKPLSDRIADFAEGALKRKSKSDYESDGWHFEFVDHKSERLFFTGYRYSGKVQCPVIQTKTLKKGQLQIEISGIDSSLFKEKVITRLLVKDTEGVEKVVAEWNQKIWIDTDHSGRMVYADKDCLWAWANFPEGEPKLIADLNGNTFEEVVPPDWALKP